MQTRVSDNNGNTTQTFNNQRTYNPNNITPVRYNGTSTPIRRTSGASGNNIRNLSKSPIQSRNILTPQYTPQKNISNVNGEPRRIVSSKSPIQQTHNPINSYQGNPSFGNNTTRITAPTYQQNPSRPYSSNQMYPQNVTTPKYQPYQQNSSAKYGPNQMHPQNFTTPTKGNNFIQTPIYNQSNNQRTYGTNTPMKRSGMYKSPSNYNYSTKSPYRSNTPISHKKRYLIDEFNGAPQDAKPEIQDIVGVNTKTYVDSNKAILKINRSLNEPANSHLYHSKKKDIRKWQSKVKKVMEENR